MAPPSLTDAPLLTTNWLNEPLLPRNSNPPIRHLAVGLINRTSLDLAVALAPITTWAELVTSELSDKTSNVNEPLVPTITLPGKTLVMLLNVLVAPSLTSWARRVGAVSSVVAKMDV